MKNRILPCLLLALLAATFARAQQDYYLRGNDTGNQCSFDGTQSPVGWATSSGGTKVSNGPEDQTGVYHVDGYLVRINRATTASISFAGGELVLDRHQTGSPTGTGVPAINHKMAHNSETTIPRLRVPAGSRAELRQGGTGSGDGSNKNITGTNWVVEAGAELCFNIGENGTRYWTCSAPFFGEGQISAGMGITEPSTRVWATDQATATGSVTLTGDLSAFAGFLSAGEMGLTYLPTASHKTHEEVVSSFKLVIGATDAMPQASPGGALLRAATVVTNGATISFTCDATSPTNRGWTFGSGAVPKVEVADGCTATIEGPVEGTVGFAKTGAGTLVLNVGGAGEYGTMTLEGPAIVSAAELSNYVARCEAWIAGEPWIESFALATIPAETSVSFAFSATALGRGAASATLTALVLEAAADDPWSDADATPVPLATLDAATNGVFAVTGLDPSTDYQVRFVLASAAGTATSDPIAFSTPAANPVPTATLAIDTLFGTEAVLTIAVPRFGYGATALSSLVLRWGTDSSDESGWTSVALPLPASEGALQTYRLTGLASGTPHYAKVDVANDLSPARSFTTEVLSFTPSTLEVAGAARVFDVGQDRVAVFTNRAETMTITVPAATTVELLLVGGGGGGGSHVGGGGGGGGSYIGGGGGGGGFLHLENAVLDAGTYTVSIGAGGAPAATTSYAGNDGGDTVLSLGSETKYIAHGGGGGGGNKDATQRAGRSGASGGGAGNQSTAGGASTATGGERGNPGGGNTTANKGLTLASGGGHSRFACRIRQRDRRRGRRRPAVLDHGRGGLVRRRRRRGRKRPGAGRNRISSRSRRMRRRRHGMRFAR